MNKGIAKNGYRLQFFQDLANLERFTLLCSGSGMVSEAFAASEPSAAHKGRRYIKTGNALATGVSRVWRCDNRIRIEHLLAKSD